MKTKKNVLILSAVALIVLLALVLPLRKVLVKPKKEAKAKVAIVIDDWGYNLRHLNLLKQIEVPVTISILPSLRYSSKIAEIAKKQGKEVILHLPLEPETKDREIRLEEHTIMSDMSEEQIVETLELGLSSVAHISGVSNHMGSRATKDSRIMSIIFSELKKRKLFFLDNLVTDKSVCKQLAQKMKVRLALRDFFLDNSDNYEYIREQFNKLSEFAKVKGQAIGIGHARLLTLSVLKDMIPIMQDEGIEFVFVSELVK